jgi:hypothetical protein
MPDVNSALPIYSGGRSIMRANCNIAARRCRLIPAKNGQNAPSRATLYDCKRMDAHPRVANRQKMKLATVPCDGRGFRWRKFVFTTIANAKEYKRCTVAPSPNASRCRLNRQQQYRGHAKAERQDVDRRPFVNRFTAKKKRPPGPQNRQGWQQSALRC